MTLHYCITSQCLLSITSQNSFQSNLKRVKFHNSLQLLDTCVICGHCLLKYIIKTTIHGKICITPLSTLNQYQLLGLRPSGWYWSLGLIGCVYRFCHVLFSIFSKDKLQYFTVEKVIKGIICLSPVLLALHVFLETFGD
jgi:hypothetical protein